MGASAMVACACGYGESQRSTSLMLITEQVKNLSFLHFLLKKVFTVERINVNIFTNERDTINLP